MYKRLAKGFLLGLASLILLLTVLIYSVLGTQTGSHYLVNKLSEYLPDQLSFSRYKGTLLNQFEFHGLKLDSPAFSLHSEQVTVDWSPSDLLRGTARINSVTFKNAEAWIRTSTSSTESTNEGPKWPRVSLPIDAVLSNITINDVILHLPNQPAQELSVTGGLAMQQNGELQVEGLKLTHRYAEVRVDAGIQLNSSESIKIDSTMNMHVPDLPQTSMTLKTQGDIQTLNGSIVTNGSIESVTKFTVTELLDQLNFKTRTEVAETDLVPWVKSFAIAGIQSASIEGDINTQGSLNEIDITPSLNLSVNDQAGEFDGYVLYQKQHIRFTPLNVSLNGQVAADLAIEGAIALDSVPQFDLEVTSKQLNTERLRGTSISDLRLLVEGTLRELSVLPEFKIKTNAQPEIEVAADIDVTDEQLNVTQLTVVQNNNQITGTLHANLANQQFETNLQGEWQNDPIQLNANVRYDSPYIFINRFALNWRSNTVTASGDLRPGSALKFDVDITDLAALPVPNLDLSGSLNAKGNLSGSINDPQVTAHVQSPHINIGERRLNDINLNFDGDLSEQTTKLKLSYQDIALAFATDTTITEKELTANITAFSIEQPDIGRFALREVSKLEYQFNPQQVKLTELCVSQKDEHVCVSATTNDRRLTSSLSVSDLPISLVEPFLPLNNLALSGSLSGELTNEVDLVDALSVNQMDGRFNVTDMRIEQNEQHIDFEKAELRIAKGADEKRISTRLNLLSEDAGAEITADLTLPSLLKAPSLEGTIEAQLDDLSIVQTFTNQVAQVNGSLDAAVTIETRDEQILLTPTARVNIANALVTRTGTSISDTTVNVSGNTGSPQLTLSGEGKVGDGDFTLSGEFNLKDLTGTLDLKGTDLVVMDSPRIRITATPNLKLNLTKDIIALNGEVKIPEANITPPNLSSTITPSPDVTVIQRERVKEQSRTIKTDLKITLGDNVRVDAYGFNGRLEGALNLAQTGQSVPIGNGTISVAKGDYEIYGQELSIDRGQFIFNGGPLSNPALNLRVTRSLSEVTDGPNTVGARVMGTLNRPELDLFSDPAMPDASVLSYLLFGRGPSSNSESQNLELQAALLVGGKTTGALTQSLKDTFSLDEVAIDSETSDVNDTSLYIGKYLSPNLYIKYGIGLIESTSSFYLRYRFTDNLWFESTSSTESQGADIIYSIER